MSTALQPILALLGHPVGGNPTQYMLQKALDQCQLDWRYLTLDVVPEDLGDAVRGMRAMGFAGGNCAEPHKQAVLPHLDRTTDVAALSGVVNVIFRDETGLVGDNTEGRALVESLKPQMELAEKRVVLLGAGRVARAIAVELAQADVAELVVVDRTATHAEELVSLVTGKYEMVASAIPWEDDYALAAETDLLVQATSATDEDSEATLPIVPSTLVKGLLVADMAYNPPDTWLLDVARAQGCEVLDGLSIFIQQMALNFALWTGMEPDPTVLREAVEEFLEL